MKQGQDKTGADSGGGRPKRDGYSLADGSLREILSPSGEAAGAGPGLPPLAEDSWPLWERALLSSDPEVQEQALFLLTNPVLNEELFHYRFLARKGERLAAIWSRTGRPELLEMVLRLAGAWARGTGPARPLEGLSGSGRREEIGRVLGGMEGEADLERLGGFLPTGITEEVLGGRETAPFRLLAELKGLLARQGEDGFRERWKRIKELLGRGEFEPACQEAGPGWGWLIQAGAHPAGPGREPGGLLLWDGLDGPALSFFEALLEVWAGELSEVRRICDRVAAGTGRLVIALFNANRAASLGWGLAQEGESGPLIWPPEMDGGRSGAGSGSDQGVADAVNGLRRMWLERRAQPALEKTLAGLADWYRFNGQEAEFASLLRSSPRTEGFRPGEIFGHTRPFSLSPKSVPEQRLSRVLDLIDRREAAWGAPLQDWLDSARALGSAIRDKDQAVVMGLTDKFTASTAAGEDRDYLREWIRLLRETAPQAVILLFDDTSRARAHLAKTLAGLPDCLGLGPYGQVPEDDPASIIISQAAPGRLFGLRIRPRRGKRGSLESWLKNPSPGLLAPGVYDPGWRDGLDQILSGTAQEVLAGSFRPFGARVVTSTGLWPLGSYCRKRLKTLAKA